MTSADEVLALAILTARVGRLELQRRDKKPADYASEPNTYGLPEGEDVADELKKWFHKQQKAVLGTVKELGKALPSSVPSVTDWTEPMATAMVPLIGAYWDDSGKAVMGRLGLDPDSFDVTNPHLKSKVAKACFNFCDSTNKTTDLKLSKALTELRKSFSEGLVAEGESVDLLADRVKAIFTKLSDSHAYTIAATETSRAYHAAQYEADVESGVVAGVELLLSSDACPLCRMVATECKRVPLGESFAVIGSHPDYSHIRFPPIHPRCQCALIEVLKPEYGGPPKPEWGHTLDQPKPAGWEPKPGKKVPEPEPEKVGKPIKAEPPPARPGPAGRPVADALEVTFKGETGEAVETAIEAIGRVHGTGQVEPKRIPVVPSESTTTNGLFSRDRLTGEALNITVSTNGHTPALTAAHEVGHFLDRAVIPGHKAATRDVADDPLFKEWYDAVRSSKAYARLEDAEAPGRGYVDYLLKPAELWARAYAQYIATRSRDARMMQELERVRLADYTAPRQWADEDFRPIAATIDRLFIEIGWANP